MFGRWFISNLDLPERIAKKTELNKYDSATFYGGDKKVTQTTLFYLKNYLTRLYILFNF